MFKRRTPRSWAAAFREFLWPRSGWARAASYVGKRVRRIPDTPEKIARGVFAGVFTAFTPFYGFHFITSVIVAVIVRGNIIAALLATFFGNPLTYFPIGVVSLQTGYFLLGGREPPSSGEVESGLFASFAGAGADLWANFMAVFTPDRADWTRLAHFWDTVFLPYLVGGIGPGLLAGSICYWLSVPLIAAYQKRRKGRFARLRAKALAKAARSEKSGG